ncbi:MAG TPA: anti-sigma factor [Egibacteraceae bacterium]|nr:anti-sigma factor [Egibacteraceae bacterium]
MTPCDEIRLNLGGYVLGGLTAEESAWVDEHLRDCAACRAELAELADLPELLALVAEAPPAPPESLRERVVAAAPRRRAPRRRVALLAAAALGVGVLIAVAALPALLRGGQQPETVATLEMTSGEGFDAWGSARLASVGDTLHVELALEALPQLGDDEVYEAWLSVPGSEEPLNIGRFEPQPDGTAAVTLIAQGSLDDYAGVWVTAEPDTVSPSREGPTVVRASFDELEET